ncbi:hypothetical protein DJ45_1298 [Bacillus anthracis]|nr:hypothetical protein DJ45_1298 [Bacillus anthracis]
MVENINTVCIIAILVNSLALLNITNIVQRVMKRKEPNVYGIWKKTLSKILATFV